MKKENIKVVFQHYISDELINEFNNLDFAKNLAVEYNVRKTAKTAFNSFLGVTADDVTIYMETHKVEVAVGFVSAAALDLLKVGIKLLWTGISKLTVKILTAGEPDQDKGKQIRLKITTAEKIIDVSFEGEADDSTKEKIIDKAFELINSPKVIEAFKNPELLTGETKPTISLVYNMVTKEYEPFNFAQNRQKIRNMEKWADENLSS